MGKLPKNWVETTCGELSDIIRGVSYKKHESKSIQELGDYLVLRGGNIQDGHIVDKPNDAVYVDSALIKVEQQIRKGDVIIVGSTGSKKLIGKAGIAHLDLIQISFGAFLMLVRPNHNIDSKYFDFYFLSDVYRNVIRELAGGVNINNIRKEYITGLKIPLPPLAEQQRIVAKLDDLFGHLEQVKTRLAKVPQLLKNFRQAILTQAVTGKLTEVWREGKELGEWDLKVLEAEKEKLKRDFAFSKGRKTYNHKKSIYPILNETTKGIEQFYKVPRSWSWVSLDQIVWNVSDGPHFSPNYVHKSVGKRFISMRNIGYSGIDFSDAKYVSVSDHLEFIKRGKPEKGDVLFTKGGSTGVPCVVSDDIDFSYWVHVALLKPIISAINSHYLKMTLASQLAYKQSQAFTHGVGNQDLGLTRMIKIAFPLPQLLEQTEIVSRVESLFAKADAIEAKYNSLKAQIDQLPQAILAKAFKGELVAQLPSDGDAKELLKEIQELKANKTTKPTKKNRNVSIDDNLQMAAEPRGEYGK